MGPVCSRSNSLPDKVKAVVNSNPTVIWTTKSDAFLLKLVCGAEYVCCVLMWVHSHTLRGGGGHRVSAVSLCSLLLGVMGLRVLFFHHAAASPSAILLKVIPVNSLIHQAGLRWVQFSGLLWIPNLSMNKRRNDRDELQHFIFIWDPACSPNGIWRSRLKELVHHSSKSDWGDRSEQNLSLEQKTEMSHMNREFQLRH